MTDRISHEEAQQLTIGLGEVRSHTLLRYITQQRAAEADTVSRAELNRQVTNQIERAMRAESRLTALQAEHEELKQIRDEVVRERDAAEARVAELEAVARGYLDGLTGEGPLRAILGPASVQPAPDTSSVAYWQRMEHECRSSEGTACDLCSRAMVEVQPAHGGVEREPWRFYEEFPGKPGPTPAEPQGYIHNPHFDRYVEQVTGHTLAELPKRFHGYLHTAFGEGIPVPKAREHHAKARRRKRGNRE